MIMGDTLYYPNGSSKGFPINSRRDILSTLKTKADNIIAIDIEVIKGEYIVLVNRQRNVYQ
jgi:hypothetical protein